jgi:multiple antibiotic resistance protein
MIFIGAPNHEYIGLAQIFVFLFITLGPMNFVKAFAQSTHGADAGFRRKLAIRTILIATISLLLASLVGTVLLQKWLISVGAIGMAGGLILFLVAIRSILAFYAERTTQAQSPPPASTLALAASQLAVPSIVTPYGVATVIVFLTIAPEVKWAIVGLVLAIMIIDLLVMLFARPLLRVLGVPLQLLGIVFAVLQVALSVQMIFFAFRVVFAKGV